MYAIGHHWMKTVGICSDHLLVQLKLPIMVDVIFRQFSLK